MYNFVFICSYVDMSENPYIYIYMYTYDIDMGLLITDCGRHGCEWASKTLKLCNAAGPPDACSHFLQVGRGFGT